MFSNYNGRKLEINNKEIWYIHMYMEIKPCTKINNQGVRRNKKIPWDKWKHIYQNLWNAAKVVLKGKF